MFSVTVQLHVPLLHTAYIHLFHVRITCTVGKIVVHTCKCTIYMQHGQFLIYLFTISLGIVDLFSLSSYTVPFACQINRLSRWQVIDMVRTISTEAAKSGDGG